MSENSLLRSPLSLLLAFAALFSTSLSRPMLVDNPFLTIAIDRLLNTDADAYADADDEMPM